MKAISPVLAVLMMIAVAIAGSLITYAWVTGYIGFTTEKAGQAIMIQSIAYNETAEILKVYVQNVGEGTVKLEENSSLYINDALQPCKIDLEDGVVPEKATATLTVSPITLPLGDKVTVKVTTTLGTFTEKSTYPTSTTITDGGPPPDVTRVNTHVEDALSLSGGVGTETWTTAPTPGNFLVLVAGHRQGDPFDHYNTMTVDGWTRDEVAYGTLGNGDTGHRRIVVVFSRVADGTADDNPTIHWNDPDGGGVSVCYMILQEFSSTGTSITKVDSGSVENGDSGGSQTMNTPTLSTSSENILAIGGMSSRGGVTGLSFSGLGGLLELTPEPTANGIEGASAYDYTQGTATVLTTTISWTNTNREAAGLLVLYSCS